MPKAPAVSERCCTGDDLAARARLTEQLRKAEIVIDVQKKVAALLGWPIPTPDPDEKP